VRCWPPAPSWECKGPNDWTDIEITGLLNDSPGDEPFLDEHRRWRKALDIAVALEIGCVERENALSIA
jgi:hypothetical protein